jgi:hypothetical protein
VEPHDLRKSFNGLAALVSEHLDADPYQGALYLFREERGLTKGLPRAPRTYTGKSGKCGH